MTLLEFTEILVQRPLEISRRVAKLLGRNGCSRQKVGTRGGDRDDARGGSPREDVRDAFGREVRTHGLMVGSCLRDPEREDLEVVMIGRVDYVIEEARLGSEPRTPEFGRRRS